MIAALSRPPSRLSRTPLRAHPNTGRAHLRLRQLHRHMELPPLLPPSPTRPAHVAGTQPAPRPALLRTLPLSLALHALHYRLPQLRRRHIFPIVCQSCLRRFLEGEAGRPQVQVVDVEGLAVDYCSEMSEISALAEGDCGVRS